MKETVCMSLLVPAFKLGISEKGGIAKVQASVEKQLGITRGDEYQMFSLVPIKTDQDLMQQAGKEICVRLNDSSKFKI